MKYLAHVNKDREQLVYDHLIGTAKLASLFAGKFGKEDWGYCCGILHDVGKYSQEFQDRIRGGDRKVDHSTAGMKLCLERGGLYGFMSYCIAGHHAGLPDYGSSSDTSNAPTIVGRGKRKICDYGAYRKEVEIPKLNTIPFDIKKTKCPEYSLSVFIRMLYSCLVDADYLDTEMFMNGGNSFRNPGDSMEILYSKLEKYISGWLGNKEIDTINGRRTEILRNCLIEGSSKKGMFRLTVPTGGGKTIASLAFALKHAVENKMDRIIYVIPYTSIIEQNASVFRDILGNQNVLENHCNVENEDGEDKFNPLNLATENWDKPIVVTTNVQFFESLYGNKSSKCRKLHNIVNSTIIFDEVQMLPSDYLHPCIAMMEELVENYGVSIVLCTATQPTIDTFFSRVNDVKELCPRIKQQFEFFKRTTIEYVGKWKENKLIEYLNKENQALCIVNTKKRAQNIFNELLGEGVYHLSTTMCPKHRKHRLEEIRKRLRENKRCVVVSTSLVEAGVDLDFQTVYRQLAGVDSIIQAAGRCNREGKRTTEESSVKVFQFEEKDYIPGQRQQMDVTRMLMSDGYELADNGIIDKYFQNLYRIRENNLDKKQILKSFSTKAYEFAKVGKSFKLIEENTKTIYVKYDDEAQALLYQLKNCGFTKSLMRKASQYSINVYEQDFDKLDGVGLIRGISEDSHDFYELIDMEYYTRERGLDLNIDSGMSLFI